MKDTASLVISILILIVFVIAGAWAVRQSNITDTQVIDGHTYVVAKTYRGISIIHAGSCPCHKPQ